jgi:hypothetical protein
MVHPTDPVPSPPSRFGRFALFLPPAALVLCGIAWTGFWFYGVSRAEEAIDVWLSREAVKGRVYACGTRRIVGFPFRVELICDQPTVTVAMEGGPLLASAPRLAAVAQVYQPQRIIAEVTGPVAISDGAGGRANLSYALAQASFNVDSAGVERSSVALDAPRLVVGEVEIGAAKALQAHVRRGQDGAGVWDLALRVDDGVSQALDLVPVGTGPVQIEIQAEARGLSDLQPGPLSARLQAFAEAGGQVHVALARVVRGDVAAEARGDLELDPEGNLDGKLNMTARGVDKVVQGLMAGGGGDPLSALLGAGAGLLGKPAKLDGQSATTYAVRIDRGRVNLGPIRLGRLPKAF